jgi:hypothetical protein
MQRPRTSGEHLLEAIGIEPWWQDKPGAYQDEDHPEAERGRPSQEQALLGAAFPLACEMVRAGSGESPWDNVSEAEAALRALGTYVDRIAAADTASTPVDRDGVVLFIGDLVQRLNGGRPLAFVESAEGQ